MEDSVFRLIVLREAGDFLSALPKPAYKKIFYNIGRVAKGENAENAGKGNSKG